MNENQLNMFIFYNWTVSSRLNQKYLNHLFYQIENTNNFTFHVITAPNSVEWWLVTRDTATYFYFFIYLYIFTSPQRIV